MCGGSQCKMGSLDLPEFAALRPKNLLHATVVRCVLKESR
jgi:hypothetical protein